MEREGYRLRVIRPRRPPGLLGHTLQRFTFNAGIPLDAVTDADLVIGLDMDGFMIAESCNRFVCYLMGVLADEARFERGVVARLLRLQARAERVCARRAALVLTTSLYSRERASDEYGVPLDRIGVVPPAFDVERWRLDLNAAEARRERESGPVVLCVAHMYPRKNISALIRISRLIIDRVPEAQIRVVGDGPERSRLQKLVDALGVQASVHLLGHLPHRELLREFSACDVFCLPSLQEGFGIAFLEAMASGKPVVGLRASSTPELIEHEVNGLLARPHDEVDLAEQLTRALEDTHLRKAMARANMAKAERYDASRTVKGLIDLVAQLD
jgi:glycosyltransferase involved in cell wall biosynthesis